MKKKENKKKIVKDVKKFIVERKKWYRGNGATDSCLLNNSGKMCCLGFYAQACGLEPKIIRNLPSPEEAVRVSQGKEVDDRHGNAITRVSNNIWNTKLVKNKGNTPTCCSMMNVNDRKDLSEEEREMKLTSLFKRINIQVKFK